MSHLFHLPDWKTHCKLIQDVSELPNWKGAKELYLDLETTSENDKIASLNPWKNCKILGISILVDDEQIPIYIPLRHRDPVTLSGIRFHNLPVANILEWVRDILSTATLWINHNIKYDAHVLEREGIDFRKHSVKLIDTLVLAKLAPKEERFTYNLTDVMKEWFYIDISSYENKETRGIKAYLGRGEYDYGLIPIDVMCPYSCVDVLAARELYRQLIAMIEVDCTPIMDLETALTPEIFTIEMNGTKVDEEKLNLDSQIIPIKMQLEQIEIARATGWMNVQPHKNADCKKIFVEELGLPIVEWTEKKQPSFGEPAILAYKTMRPDLATLMDHFLAYKELHKLFTGFTQSYLDLIIDGFVHCDYNQIVRTGRMSCRTPNMQQLSPEARMYIIPSSPDHVLVDIDFSQIEYRLVVHYTQALSAIQKYNEDPNTDFHALVAEWCGIKRKYAKNINFMLCFGGGPAKFVSMLKTQPEIIEEVRQELLGSSLWEGENEDKLREVIDGIVVERAKEATDKFYQQLPTLKSTRYRASEVLRQRGFTRTLLNRRRYLPKAAHFKAFNTVIQGSAADLFKAALLRLMQYIKDKPDIKVIAVVHDSYVLSMPKELVDVEVPKMVKVIEEIPSGLNLRVPIKANWKMSDKNWRECG